VTESRFVICWNCNTRTETGQCSNCNAELLVSDDYYKNKEEDMKENEVRNMFHIKKNGRVIFTFSLNDLKSIIERNFTIRYVVNKAPPRFIVEAEKSNFVEKFNSLIEASKDIYAGLFPIIKKYKNFSNLYEITFTFIETNPNQNRISKISFIISLITIFLSGILYAEYYAQSTESDYSGYHISGFQFSPSTVYHSYLFTTVVLIFMIIKDIHMYMLIILKQPNKIAPFYIPVPPLADLGTLGNFLNEKEISVTKMELIRKMLWGPLIAWILSLMTIIYSFNLGEVVDNPVQKNFIPFVSGSYKHVGWKVIVNFASIIGVDMSSTEGFVMHPITVAALIGFYISGINLLPVSRTNGGFLLSSIVSRRWHSIITYLVILLLFRSSIILVFLFMYIHEKYNVPETLDTVSKIPFTYVIVIIISFSFGFFSIPLIS